MLAKRINLGSDGPECSQIALGMWRLQSWNLDVGERLSLLEQGLELGISTVDHADIYASEKPFGEALRLRPSLRERMEIVSKCGILPLSGERPRQTVPHYDTSASHIVESVEQSLRSLGTDHLDLLLIHRPDPLMDADEIASAFESLRSAGKVLHFGASNFTPSQFDLLNDRISLCTNQIELSPLHLEPLHDGTLDQCQRLRITPMIWSALAGGRLFNDSDPRALRVRETLHELAEQYGVSSTTIAYAWILRHPTRPMILTGSHRVAAMREAVAASTVALSRDHWFSVWTASTGVNVP